MSDLSTEQLKKMGNKVMHAFSKAFDVFMEHLKEETHEEGSCHTCDTEKPKQEKKEDVTDKPSS